VPCRILASITIDRSRENPAFAVLSFLIRSGFGGCRSEADLFFDSIRQAMDQIDYECHA
jgi:hypothetical protein